MVALLQALAKMSSETHGEWVPFASRLAERATGLVQTGVLPVGGGLWKLISEQILLPVIDADLQASLPIPPAGVPCTHARTGAPCMQVQMQQTGPAGHAARCSRLSVHRV